MARGISHGEVQFQFYPDQPPATKAGEWRARLAGHHLGRGPTIGAALDDLAKAIDAERDAVRRARASVK